MKADRTVKLVCLVCGKVILLQQEDDVITLPDASEFRREHANCLRMSNAPSVDGAR